MLTPARDAAQAEFPPGEFIEYDLDDDSRLVPVDRPPGKNTANVVVGVIRNFTAKYPEGMTRVILLGDPSKAMGAVAEPECRRIIAALDLAERHARAARVVRRLCRRQDLDGERHREHGLDRPRPAATDRVHPGRRRSERRGQRHQRRRATVLERRSHHAAAHARHPGHDPAGRHGAHRQAGARLLGQRLGRRQSGHRRLRAHHGPQRPGTVLGARPHRGVRTSCCATTSTPTCCRANAFRVVRRPPTRSTATSVLSPHGGEASRWSATSSRTSRIPDASARSRSAG